MRAGCTRAVVIVLAVAAAALIASARAQASDVALSLRTSDGLVVAKAPEKLVERWQLLLSRMKHPPSDNAHVFRWLSQHGGMPSAINIYFDETTHARQQPQPSARTWRKSTVGESVSDGLIPFITGKELFEAYLLIRSTGADVFIDKKASPAAAPIQHNIFILSSAFMNGQDGIYIDGRNYSKNVNGYNIVTISPDGSAVTGAEGFALYESPDDSQRMADFLNNQSPGTYVVASVKTGPGVFLSYDAVAALQRYGSRENPDPQLMSSHAMFGRKGSTPGSATETSAIGLGTKIILFGSGNIIDESELDSMSARIAGSAVLLTGTKAKDAIYIFN